MSPLKTGFSITDTVSAIRKFTTENREMSTSSLTEYLRNTRVEPLCMIERSLSYQDVTKDIVLSHLNSFCSWYLQAAQRKLSIEVDGARIQGTLESLSTNRNVWDTLGLESAARFGIFDEHFSLPFSEEAALEAAAQPTQRGDGKGNQAAGFDTAESVRMITDSASLSSGKTIAIKIRDGARNDFTVPIQVRFQTKLVDAQLLADIFKANDANLDMSVRIKMLGLGDITWKELFTSEDIISAQERVRLADKKGEVVNVFNKQMHDTLYAAATGVIPINRASAVTIITAATARKLEATIRGRLSDYRVRQRFFKNTAATLLSVVDVEEEMVTTYYRGINDSADNPFSFYKREGGKSGTDILPVVKALLAGNAPRY